MNTILICSMINHKRRLSGLAFCFLLFTTLFSESNNTISDNLFKYLSQKNIQIDVQYLENSLSEQFPYNLILHSQSETESQYPLFFIIPQEEAVRNTSMIMPLTKHGDVVLCANMHSELPDEAKPSPLAGLKTFLHSAPQNAVIIILSEAHKLSEHELELIPGGNGFIASREAVQSFLHAGQLSDFTVSIQSFLLTFYRLNWVDGSDAAALCLENGFQAAELLYSDKTASPQLERYAESLSRLLDKETFSEGTQYSVIKTGNQTITLPEGLYTTSLFLIIAITLLSNCLLSFMFGKFKIENRRIFLKWWYTGPVLALIVIALTDCAQMTVTSLFTSYAEHPVWAVSLKAAFIVFSFLLICCLRYIIPLAETDYLYSFFMTLAAALDVFIFTSADMPLLLPFLIFYIIIIWARPIKKWFHRIPIFIAVSFPLVFILYKAAPYLRDDSFASFTFSTPIINILTGALFLPYLLMIICIFISLGIWNKKKGKKRIITEVAVISCVLLGTVILSATLYRNDEQHPEEDTVRIIQTKEEIAVSASGEIQNGMLFFEITLECSPQTGSVALRHEATVSSDAVLPLFAANLPFSFTDRTGTACFKLDENPVSPFVISGTAPETFPIEFTIQSWLKNADTFMQETHSITFISDNAGKNTEVRAIIK